MARIYMIVYKTVWNIYIYIEDMSETSETSETFETSETSENPRLMR